jgi:hypothetical protein
MKNFYDLFRSDVYYVFSETTVYCIIGTEVLSPYVRSSHSEIRLQFLLHIFIPYSIVSRIEGLNYFYENMFY